MGRVPRALCVANITFHVRSTPENQGIKKAEVTTSASVFDFELLLLSFDVGAGKQGLNQQGQREQVKLAQVLLSLMRSER